MNKTLVKLAVAAGVFAASFGGVAVAQDLEKSVKARRGYFQTMSYNAGMLVAMAKGEMAYDAALATRAAGSLQALGAVDVPLMFPAGTSNEEMAGDTRALPAIWEDADDFATKAVAYVEAADGVAAAAGGGLDSLKGAIGALGGSCKGCHDDYRAEDF